MKRLTLAIFSLALLSAPAARADIPAPEPEKEKKDEDNNDSGGCSLAGDTGGTWALLMLPFAAFAVGRRRE